MVQTPKVLPGQVFDPDLNELRDLVLHTHKRLPPELAGGSGSSDDDPFSWSNSHLPGFRQTLSFMPLDEFFSLLLVEGIIDTSLGSTPSAVSAGIQALIDGGQEQSGWLVADLKPEALLTLMANRRTGSPIQSGTGRAHDALSALATIYDTSRTKIATTATIAALNAWDFADITFGAGKKSYVVTWHDLAAGADDALLIENGGNLVPTRFDNKLSWENDSDFDNTPAEVKAHFDAVDAVEEGQRAMRLVIGLGSRAVGYLLSFNGNDPTTGTVNLSWRGESIGLPIPSSGVFDKSLSESFLWVTQLVFDNAITTLGLENEIQVGVYERNIFSPSSVLTGNSGNDGCYIVFFPAVGHSESSSSGVAEDDFPETIRDVLPTITSDTTGTGATITEVVFDAHGDFLGGDGSVLKDEHGQAYRSIGLSNTGTWLKAKLTSFFQELKDLGVDYLNYLIFDYEDGLQHRDLNNYDEGVWEALTSDSRWETEIRPRIGETADAAVKDFSFHTMDQGDPEVLIWDALMHTRVAEWLTDYQYAAAEAVGWAPMSSNYNHYTNMHTSRHGGQPTGRHGQWSAIGNFVGTSVSASFYGNTHNYWRGDIDAAASKDFDHEPLATASELGHYFSRRQSQRVKIKTMSRDSEGIVTVTVFNESEIDSSRRRGNYTYLNGLRVGDRVRWSPVGSLTAGDTDDRDAFAMDEGLHFRVLTVSEDFTSCTVLDENVNSGSSESSSSGADYTIPEVEWSGLNGSTGYIQVAEPYENVAGDIQQSKSFHMASHKTQMNWLPYQNHGANVQMEHTGYSTELMLVSLLTGADPENHTNQLFWNSVTADPTKLAASDHLVSGLLTELDEIMGGKAYRVLSPYRTPMTNREHHFIIPVSAPNGMFARVVFRTDAIGRLSLSEHVGPISEVGEYPFRFRTLDGTVHYLPGVLMEEPGEILGEVTPRVGCWVKLQRTPSSQATVDTELWPA